jgi:hypothetical protein
MSASAATAKRIILSLAAFALVASSDAATITSPLRRSEQFIVVDARTASARSPGQLRSKSGEALVRLDPDTLLLTAERIKDAMLVELGLTSERRSPEVPNKIRLLLYPATKADPLIAVISTRSPEGWDYRIEMPDQIGPEQLVRSVVHGVLLERANRGQGPKSAELPLWLVEGLTAHVRAVAGADLVVDSVPIGSMLRIVRERQGLDYLKKAREVLASHRPLSFSELAYPRRENLVGEQLAVYQYSSQLFVYELLHTRDGPANLVRMLRELPRYWNWEVALLRGFPNEFQRMLDVEKKWSVDVLAFTVRDASRVWSRVMSLNRLDELLSVAAQVRVSADRLPNRKVLTLQELISTWEFSAQEPILRQKVSLLEVLRFNASPELVPLIDSYRQTLSSYIIKRNQAGRTLETRMQPNLSGSLVAQDAVRELELLDKRREAFRPENVLSVNSPISR